MCIAGAGLEPTEARFRTCLADLIFPRGKLEPIAAGKKRAAQLEEARHPNEPCCDTPIRRTGEGHAGLQELSQCREYRCDLRLRSRTRLEGAASRPSQATVVGRSGSARAPPFRASARDSGRILRARRPAPRPREAALARCQRESSSSRCRSLARAARGAIAPAPEATEAVPRGGA